MQPHGRLLAQVVEAPLIDPTPLNAPAPGASWTISFPNEQPSMLTKMETKALDFATQRWVVVCASMFCGVLLAVLVWQWTTELRAWRQRTRQQEQNEACKEHIQAYADIESPTKLTTQTLPEPHSTSVVHTYAANPLPATATITLSQVLTQPPNNLLRLPSNSLIRRAPSLRCSGSPRNFRALGPLRRSGSLSRTSSLSKSMCGSPKSPKAYELTVDESVKARDTSATGWVPHPHARRSPFSSAPGTPTGRDGGDNIFSPRLMLALNTLGAQQVAHSRNDGNNGVKHRLATEGPPNKEYKDQSSNNGLMNVVEHPNKNLVRMQTAAGFMDFKLTTSVAEDASVDEEEAYDKVPPLPLVENDGAGPSSIVSSNMSTVTGLQKALSTAKSILPWDVASLKTESQDETGNSSQRIAHSVPHLTSLHGHIAILTPTQFNEEIQLVHLLGAGGAGSVHQGLWRGKQVAVKILHPSRQTSPSAVDSFRREVDLMASVDSHPGVVSCYAACLTPPHLAVVTELAAGGSVHSVLHEAGMRPRYGTLLKLAEQVAAAMAFCHSIKLVHRDLKTHNVLLDANGTAKIADFGLAASRHRTFLTVEPGALGTASVMAPEQFAAHEVTERCDSYAFGCLLWEMITGRQPWEECNNIMQIVMAVGCERKRPPIPEDCPAAVSRLIRECWRHNAALRPGFEEILERLRKIQRDDSADMAINSFSGDLQKQHVKLSGVTKTAAPAQRPPDFAHLTAALKTSNVF